MTVHAKRVIFAHLTEIEFSISFESLDITTSNSVSGGFISVSVLKLRHLKWIILRATHSRKQATSVFLHDSVYLLSHDTNTVSRRTLMTFIAPYYYKNGVFPVVRILKIRNYSHKMIQFVTVTPRKVRKIYFEQY